MKIESKELMLEFFDYNHETGSIIFKHRDNKWFKADWAAKMWNEQWAGKEVGCDCGKGYKRTQIFGKKVLVHRICWTIVNGVTDSDIDHINGDRSDNRISNLRIATKTQNRMNQGVPKNNKSGFVGVSWAKHKGQWMASISVAGKKINLGYYELIDDAISARKLANEKYGYHCNHGARRSHRYEIISHG